LKPTFSHLEFQNEKERKTFSNDFPAKQVRFPENIICKMVFFVFFRGNKSRKGVFQLAAAQNNLEIPEADLTNRFSGFLWRKANEKTIMSDFFWRKPSRQEAFQVCFRGSKSAMELSHLKSSISSFLWRKPMRKGSFRLRLSGSGLETEDFSWDFAEPHEEMPIPRSF